MKTSQQYGLDLDPDAPVWRLSVGERQKLEIVKLLLARARVLVFDEPTRSLAPHEVAALLDVVAALKRDGYAVVLIAHKLAEVLAVADRVTVMRRGRVVASLPRAEASEAALVPLMFDEPVREAAPRPAATSSRRVPALELRGVRVRAEAHGVGLADVDLAVEPGEVVGVAGVSGNGQRELGDVILGAVPCATGRKWLGGQAWPSCPTTRWGSPRCPRSPCSRTPRWATRGATRAPAAWRWTGPRRGTTRRGRSRGWASRCRRWMPRWGRYRAATSSAPCWPASWPTRRG